MRYFAIVFVALCLLAGVIAKSDAGPGVIPLFLAPAATASPSPSPSGGVPTPQGYGMVSSCSPIYGVSTCESNDATLVTYGITYSMNYNFVQAHLTGANSIDAELTYDDSIGLKQYVNIGDGIKSDNGNIATGTGFVTGRGVQIASDCGTSTDQATFACMYNTVLKNHASFEGWYIADEPGCPAQTIGYCQASWAGGNYYTINNAAIYLRTLDPTHDIWLNQTPSGTANQTESGIQTQENNLYSCNSQAPCSGASPWPWLTSSTTPHVGLDHYPFSSSAGQQTTFFATAPPVSGSNAAGQAVADLNYVIPAIANVYQANYSAETQDFVGQSFSWWGEGACSINVTLANSPAAGTNVTVTLSQGSQVITTGDSVAINTGGGDAEVVFVTTGGTGSFTATLVNNHTAGESAKAGYYQCVYPTQAQQLMQRNEALWYAYASGYPIRVFWWYFLSDVVCGSGVGYPKPIYSGCNATTNLQAIQNVDSAPLPTSAPD